MAFFNSNFLLQLTPQEHDHHTTPQEFHGVASLLGKRSSMSFSTGIDICEDHTNNNNHGEDELSDDGSVVGEKKRRLNIDQVKTLERNFESCNKLEPEKKIQLAKTLGLQPRQVAIWFQNRRARWKTKQLEKDYDLLKGHFDAVKLENEALLSQNKKLLAEIMALKTREPTESINLNKETEGSCSNRSENSSEIMKLDIYSSSRNNYPAIDSNLSTAMNTSNGGVTTQIQNCVKEESSSLCNMFCGMDDQTGFWPWLDQQNFN